MFENYPIYRVIYCLQFFWRKRVIFPDTVKNTPKITEMCSMNSSGWLVLLVFFQQNLANTCRGAKLKIQITDYFSNMADFFLKSFSERTIRYYIYAHHCAFLMKIDTNRWYFSISRLTLQITRPFKIQVKYHRSKP